MDFQLAPELAELQATVRKLAQERIAPRAVGALWLNYTRPIDTRIEGNDEFYAEAVPLASKALGTARRYRSNMAFRNGALALCRLAESRSASAARRRY